jgi:hypothetical protein
MTTSETFSYFSFTTLGSVFPGQRRPYNSPEHIELKYNVL